MLQAPTSGRGVRALQGYQNGTHCVYHRIGSQRSSRPTRATVRAEAGKALEPGALVLVAGATGGVGQLVAGKLLERGYRVRAIDRGSGRAAAMFGSYGDKLEVVKADLRDESSLGPQVTDGVDAVVSATGTTAFPTSRWEGNNGPKPTDYVGATNLIRATPKSVSRFVYVTSAGVERQEQFPWLILNLFGVLKYKHLSELELKASGLPYTIFRPSRLTDGPYTSFDLNTLLKSTAGNRKRIILSSKDELLGEASRIAVAEAIVQSLQMPETANKVYALESSEGDGPGDDPQQWKSLFAAVA